MSTLYHNPFSQHGRRVVSLLEEAGIDYDLRTIRFDEGEHMSADYLQINPNHQVPTLVDGDIKIHESNAILRYVCQKHGLTEWYPEDPKARARVDQWLDWNQCRLSPSVVDIVLNKVFMGEDGDKAAIARGEAKMPELMAILEAGLEASPCLAGAGPTIADLSVASNIFHLTFAGIEPELPNTKTWFGRISALDGFKKSLPQA